MKRLFIAEKPAMAKDIASHMPGRRTGNTKGFIEIDAGRGDIYWVTWCIGHLLEQVQPQEYDVKFQAWEFENLPILPRDWKLKIAEGKADQVKVIKGLLKECDEVVNAGDPGREGQLIVDELLEFCGNRKPVKRILLNSLDAATVRRELANLHDNSKYRALYDAGLGRQRADWLVGMNLTRAYTVLARRTNYRGVLTVGRVQSPTLALVVRRDRAIEGFVPRDYWAIRARVRVQGGEFWARWKKPDPAPQWLDEEGRIVDQTEADRIVRATHGQVGQISRCETKPGKEEPPLPFSLATLQIFASGKWGYSALEVLDACQELYMLKATSYPRTDSSWLVTALQAQIPDTLDAVAATDPSLAPHCARANPAILGKAWDDSKVGEHYALIPTTQAADWNALSPIQQNLYRAIARRYIAIFYPDCLVERTTVEATVSQETFVANGRVVKSPGWRAVYAQEEPEPETPDATGKVDEEKEADQLFPPLTLGQPAQAAETRCEQKKTKPPARMSDASLLLAMTNVHQLVADPRMKQRLKDSKGIGTSATRASIVENLVKRNLLVRSKKTLTSSPAARVLVDALPPTLLDPALSAMWETVLDQIAEGRVELDLFVQKQEAWVAQLVNEAKATKLGEMPHSGTSGFPTSGGASAGGAGAARSPRGAGAGSRVSSGAGSTRSASSRPAGSSSGSGASAGAKTPPTPGSVVVGSTCLKCKKGTMKLRQAKTGLKAGKAFLGCSNYPACKNAVDLPEN